MALKDVDLEAGLRRLAERRIEEAMRDGKFDNLPGAGKPLELEPMPAEENARLQWWVLRILKNNDFTPDEVRWRKQVDALKDELHAARDDAKVCRLVAQINLLVYKLNTLGTNALQAPMVPLSLAVERERMKRRSEG